MSEVLKRSYIDIETLRVVISHEVNRSLGRFDKEPPRGFSFDERHIFNQEVCETLPNPGLKKNSLRNLPLTVWSNGPTALANSLQVKDISRVMEGRKVHWTPTILPGEVSIHRNIFNLFSNNSSVEYVNPDNVDSGGRNFHIITQDVSPDSSILASIYMRSISGEYLPWREYLQRHNFSGLLNSDGERLETDILGEIVWNNIDDSKREFIVQGNEEGILLQFNQPVIESITSLTAPISLDDFNDLEYLGDGDGSKKTFFKSKFFPIVNNSNLAVYVVDVATGLWDTPTIITEGIPEVDEIFVDLDMGFVKFGFPPNLDMGIYLQYRVGPRFEYEPTNFPLEYSGLTADVNPKNQPLNRGFVVLSTSSAEVSRLVLETNSPLYPFLGGLEAFGPIFVGAGYALLKCTAYSSTEEVVPNIEIEFSIRSTPAFGSLGGSGETSEAITNFDGEAYSFYSSPNTSDGLGVYSANVSGAMINVEEFGPIQDLNNVYTYMVLKDDALLGKVSAGEGEVEWTPSPPTGRKVVLYHWDSEAINPITGFKGSYSPVRPINYDEGVFTYSQTLDIPSLTDSTINLGSYWIVSDRVLEIQASCLSPRTGVRIYSNIIALRVELPAYMKGEYISEALRKVPFGWRIPDDNYNVASALNKATFITINPVAGPYPILDVIAGESWDDYPIPWGPYSGYSGYGYSGYPVPSGASKPFLVISLGVEVVVP